MKKLNQEAFERARGFLKTQARSLDRAIFEHRFEEAPAGRVTTELAHYQNDDGGFGHALEPDLRTPSSSALATGIALRVLKELQYPADHPMVRHAVQFLGETYDPKAQVWRVAPDDANRFPHAPWWHDEYGSLADTFDDFRIIPRAEIVGLLHHYSALVPSDWLEGVTEDTVVAIETMQTEKFSGGGDTLSYALSLAQMGSTPQRFRDRLLPRLRTVALSVVSRDAQEWSGYCAAPLKVAPSPDSPIADLLWDDLQAHLDYQIERQTAEGTWDPVWTWGDYYPEAWARARQEWRGHLTLETLTSLCSFGRTEE
jgi:hypothetical protein